ncbi:oxidoreductase [Sphingomonas sp. PAMC 26605]|uniref:oxidoreductase n=1 Tax=Sphingomonas sp. PAMC 26605 TaxID=1112214 RepID=UPI00026CDE42|nr:oxidoreductase [Sphingomonas sp. PAMC 26605]
MSKVWLITGSSRGLGKALAEAVLANGDRLVATARSAGSLAGLAQRYQANVLPFTLDVTSIAGADSAIKAAIETFGRLDVVANVAGFGNIGSVEDTSAEEIRAQIETNLFGVINVTKSAIPVMRRQGSGHFIQFSSVGGRIGSTGRAAYSAAKWGVEGFSEALSKEIAPLGIKVTIVEPGGFRTDFAGSSTSINESGQDYASTVGAAARFQREYDGMQPGDPARAAQAILEVARLDAPPLRLLLGSDAVSIVEKADLAKMESDRLWRSLSISTDFPVD